jgi:hypothetical protein
MTPHAPQLRHRFLVAMGLGSLSLGLLPGCDSGEEASAEAGETPAAEPVDGDGDGFAEDQDCDDASAAVSPEAEEICDGVDNNCDGVVDTDARDRSTWYTDTDADGYGDARAPQLACAAPEGAVADSTDCAPEDPAIHPGADEAIQDRIDNNCDGMVDEMTCPEATAPTTVRAIQSDRGRTPQQFCMDRPEDGEACPGADEIQATSLVNETVGFAPSGTSDTLGPYSSQWQSRDPVCGPEASSPEACCYVFRVREDRQSIFETGTPYKDTLSGGDEVLIGVDAKPVHGRPLTVQGVPRTAPTADSTDWDRALDLDLSALRPAQRTQLAQAWQQAALYEHASVASFARFALELMALGAPPELLIAATRAQAEEIAHAQTCFSMASAFAGRPLGPGPLDLSGALDTPATPTRMLVQTLLEGCINETLAAAEAAWLSERAEIRAIRRAQTQIAIDETRHAALGWKTVRWLLQKHPELVALAQATFEHARPTAVPDAQTDDAWMAAYGCMPEAERAALRTDVWAQVIEPCAAALMEASQGSEQAPLSA